MRQATNQCERHYCTVICIPMRKHVLTLPWMGVSDASNKKTSSIQPYSTVLGAATNRRALLEQQEMPNRAIVRATSCPPSSSIIVQYSILI